MVSVEGGFEEGDCGDAVGDVHYFARFVGCHEPAEKFVLAIAEQFRDHLTIATNRVVADARDKRRPLANEILAGGFENQFFASCYSPLVNPLGHLPPNGALANLAALYPFNGLPDLHRHFKLAITLGLSEGGQSAFVP